MKNLRYQLVLAMVVAASAVGMLVYYFTENWRISVTVAGLLLLTDLTFVPKMLPHIFKKDNEDNDE